MLNSEYDEAQIFNILAKYTGQFNKTKGNISIPIKL